MRTTRWRCSTVSPASCCPALPLDRDTERVVISDEVGLQFYRIQKIFSDDIGIQGAIPRG